MRNISAKYLFFAWIRTLTCGIQPEGRSWQQTESDQDGLKKPKVQIRICKNQVLTNRIYVV
jgi:hypothetical protein